MYTDRRINGARDGIGNGVNAPLAASSPCRVTATWRSTSSEALKTTGSFARDSAPTTRTCEQKRYNLTIEIDSGFVVGRNACCGKKNTLTLRHRRRSRAFFESARPYWNGTCMCRDVVGDVSVHRITTMGTGFGRGRRMTTIGGRKDGRGSHVDRRLTVCRQLNGRRSGRSFYKVFAPRRAIRPSPQRPLVPPPRPFNRW